MQRSLAHRPLQVLSVSIILLLAVLAPDHSFSQINFNLAPCIGVQTQHSYVVEKTNADSRFKAHNFAATASFSLSLQMDIQNDWMFFAGWKTNNFVVSYKYGHSLVNRVRRSSPAFSFPIGMQKTVGTHSWLKIRADDKFFNRIAGTQSTLSKYLLLFRSRIISGMSYDLTGNITGNAPTGNLTNISVFFGLALQFFDAENDRLQLNIFYSQGIKEISRVDVSYMINKKAFSGVIGSKGSFLAVQMAYPLQLSKI